MHQPDNCEQSREKWDTAHSLHGMPETRIQTHAREQYLLLVWKTRIFQAHASPQEHKPVVPVWRAHLLSRRKSLFCPRALLLLAARRTETRVRNRSMFPSPPFALVFFYLSFFWLPRRLSAAEIVTCCDAIKESFVCSDWFDFFRLFADFALILNSRRRLSRAGRSGVVWNKKSAR